MSAVAGLATASAAWRLLPARMSAAQFATVTVCWIGASVLGIAVGFGGFVACLFIRG